MRCKRVRKELSAYIDGEVSSRARTRLERHLAGCAACQQYKDSLSRLVESMRRVGEVEPSAEFWSTTMRGIRTAMKVPGATAPVVPRWATALVVCLAVVLGVVGWVVFSANRAEPEAIDRSLLKQVAFLDTVLSDETPNGQSAEALSSLEETGLWTDLQGIGYEESSLTSAISYSGEPDAVEEIVETLSSAERTEFRTVLLEMVKEG